MYVAFVVRKQEVEPTDVSVKTNTVAMASCDEIEATMVINNFHTFD